MSYSDFTLAKVKKDFDLITVEKMDIYSNIAELECSTLLTEILRYTAVAKAIRTLAKY